MAGRRKTPAEERFMEKVIKSDSGCWQWSAFRMKNGYGLFSKDGANRLAHRISYQLFKGDPRGALVLHSCDNPGCVNPAHLTLGDQKANMSDASAKGRSARAEGHGRHVLTAGKVKLIRLMSMPQRRIAEIIGVSQGHVSNIKTGKTWRDLTAQGV